MPDDLTAPACVCRAWLPGSDPICPVHGKPVQASDRAFDNGDDYMRFLVHGIRFWYLPVEGAILRIIPNTKAAGASAMLSLTRSQAAWLN